MKTHKCEKCGYKTKYKTHFERHLNRKKQCSSLKETPAQEGKSPSAIKNSPSATTKSPSVSNQTISLDKSLFSKKQKKIASLTCKFCNKIFSRSDNLKTHVNLIRCKEHKQSIEDNEDHEFIIEEDNSHDSIEHNKIENLTKIVQEMQAKIYDLEHKPTIINHNTNHNHVHMYCVMMDEASIENVLKTYFTKDVFYDGPSGGIAMLHKMLFKKDILLLDSGRQIFQYKTILKDETNEKVIKDVKHFQALCSVGKLYEKYATLMMYSEMEKYSDDPLRVSHIYNIGQQHIKMINNGNSWAQNWAKTLGK